MDARGAEEITQRCFALWNERRFDELVEYFTEDMVWDMRPIGVPGMEVYKGHAGLLRFWKQWLEAFPDARIEVESVETRGNCTLSALDQMVSGASSGAPVPFRYFTVTLWREARAEQAENHSDEQLARATFEEWAREQAATGTGPDN